MKNNIKRMAALILSVLLMVGSFAQTAMATDSNEHDTETGYPLLNAIISELDEDEIINAKMTKNEQKYPVEKSRGKATKYTRL